MLKVLAVAMLILHIFDWPPPFRSQSGVTYLKRFNHLWSKNFRHPGLAVLFNLPFTNLECKGIIFVSG